MNSARWKEISEAFSRARELPSPGRESFLSELEAADPELAIEVRRLLSSHERASDFLEPPSDTQISGPVRRLSMDFRGMQLGDFELEREIGRGAAGVVYLGRQLSLDRKVAIKLLQLQHCGPGLNRERFEREARAASRLRHPAIVSVLAYGEQGGALYLVMEYVQGQSLHEHLRAVREARANGTPLPAIDVSEPVRAASIVKQIAEALQYCHRERLLHRDIKPQNVLLDRDLQPRIVDFGLAKDLRDEQMTDAGLMSGTLHYMSPEQALARSSELDARTDVYSLGVVLHELLTLRRPLEHVEPSELLHQLTHVEPRPFEMLEQGLPKDLVAVCMKALARQPEHRYASAGEMAADLERWLAGERVHARRVTALRRTWRTVVRERYKIAAVLLLVTFTALMVEGTRSETGNETVAARSQAPRRVIHRVARDPSSAWPSEYPEIEFGEGGQITLTSTYDDWDLTQLKEYVEEAVVDAQEPIIYMYYMALNTYLKAHAFDE